MVAFYDVGFSDFDHFINSSLFAEHTGSEMLEERNTKGSNSLTKKESDSKESPTKGISTFFVSKGAFPFSPFGLCWF